MGVSGIVQRIKGKTQADNIFIGKGGVNEYVYGVVDVSVTPNSSLPNSGVSVLKSSSASNFAILQAPEPGIEKVIYVTSMSSSSLVVKTNSTGVVTFDGVNSYWRPSTTSAVGFCISLVGLSTSQWMNLGVTPPSSLAATFQGLQNTTSS